MADILLTLNGIGHGHLVRAVQISRWLRRRHRRPVIFLQGNYPEDLSRRIPGAGVWPLYELPPATAQLIVDQIASYASMNAPAVVIEDTHPAPVAWPPHIIRFLVVRPTAFAHMEHLRAQQVSGIARVMICDHPDSPSWPYDATETKTILGWDRWSAIGPIYRRPTARGLNVIRERYRMNDRDPLFVFTLGGGGQRPGSNDCASFIEQALGLAVRLRAWWPTARLLFVRGPLFPPDIAIPAPFEVVGLEPELPSLLRLAHGSVIRPGFNVMWECIAAQTPFIALRGTTYAEPIEQRLTRLRDHGIDHAVPVEQWADPGWRARYRDACEAATTRFSGDPAAAFFAAFDAGLQDRRSKVAPSGPLKVGEGDGDDDDHEELKARLREHSGSKELLVRVDDVIGDRPAMAWIIRACAERSLPVSLEVIPYFSRLDRRRLDALDPSGLCEISQHGYAHTPHGRGGPSGRGEFAGHAIDPSSAAAALLARGRRLLARTFGDRFKGGYSAPYDGWPEGLAALWLSLGGRYVSWIFNRPDARRIAQVQVGVDVWDWRVDAPKTPAAIRARCLDSIRRRAPTGLVLHPQCLESDRSRGALENLLDALLDGGYRGERVSRAALESDDSLVSHR